jgi:ABC-2 type transport system ATP-binding protein
VTAAVAELQDAVKQYGTTTALAGVSLRIEQGEVVALLGPNGAGKTTAVRLLVGLRRPDAGRALLFGRDPRRAAARRRCGVTPQETDAPATLRVRELLDFVGAHYADPLPTSAALERFDLRELAARQFGGLSGGQRRRVAVALAFVGDPDLVVLDEPTAGLDAESRRSVWETVESFAAAGRSILITTHDLREAERLASRVVVVERGCIQVDAPPDEVRDRAGHTAVQLRRQRLPRLHNEDRREEEGDRLTIFTRVPELLMRELVALRADLEELAVMRVSLEDALEREQR